MVYHTIRLSKGGDLALPGLWEGEADETGHSEESGVEGGVEWSERGGLGVGVCLGGGGGGWGGCKYLHHFMLDVLLASSALVFAHSSFFYVAVLPVFDPNHLP